MCVSQSISLSRTPRRVASLRIVGGFYRWSFSPADTALSINRPRPARSYCSLVFGSTLLTRSIASLVVSLYRQLFSRAPCRRARQLRLARHPHRDGNGHDLGHASGWRDKLRIQRGWRANRERQLFAHALLFPFAVDLAWWTEGARAQRARPDPPQLSPRPSRGRSQPRARFPNADVHSSDAARRKLGRLPTGRFWATGDANQTFFEPDG